MVEKFKPQELNVSDQAIAKIKNLLDEETKDNLSLRVFVTVSYTHLTLPTNTPV